MSKFIKHAIIRNKKSFYTMSGEYFGKNQLFKITDINDWYNTFIAFSLWERTDLSMRLNLLSSKFIRLDPKSSYMKNFEVVSGLL